MKINVKIFGPLIVLFALISAFYVITPDPGSITLQTAYLILPVLSVIAGIYASRAYGFKSDGGKALSFLTLGFFFWVVGEIIWYVFKNFMGIDPFPSVADAFFLLGYPILCLGIYGGFKLAEIRLNQLKRSVIFSNVLIAAILTAIVAYFSIYQAYDPEAGFAENAIAMSYGIGDLVLVIVSLFALAVANVYKGGRFALFWTFIALNFLFSLMADILFALFRESYVGDAKPYVYMDLLWLFGYLLFIYAMLDSYFYLKAIERNLKTP